MQAQPAHRIYEFGDFELDALRRVLISRSDGQQVGITGRALEALIYLVERPGGLVDKKTLMDAVWPHVVVEEGNLTQTIHTLRRVLGERPGEHRYIATVPGRGYRFVAEVSVREGQPESAVVKQRRSKAALVGVALSVVLLAVAAGLVWRGRSQPVEDAGFPIRPSIAVLPFVDMSAERGQEHFAEGLSEEILNLLAQTDALQVIARTSSFSFKNQNVDIGTIAQRLGVSHVLEGSVRKAGDRMRITAQLIDGSTSTHLWSDTYDRDVHDLFGVQKEIASAVAEALHVTLRQAGPRRAETASAEAYERYLQGRHLFYRRSPSDLLQAKAHFEEAVRIDPKYGRAWAALAGIYFVAPYENIELPDAVSNWGQAVERAVALAPDLAEVHVRAAQYKWNTGNRDAANAHLAQARAIDPDEPLLLGMSVSLLNRAGRLEDALVLQRRLVAADPLSATHRTNLGNILLMLDHFAEAETELERALELSPASMPVMLSIADLLIVQMRLDEAFKVISQMQPGYERDQRFALACFAAGRDSEGDTTLAQLITLAENANDDPAVALAVAEVYVAKGDADRAFQWLDATRRRAHPDHVRMPAWRLMDNLHMLPFLKPLQTDPRWKELVTSIEI